MNPAKGTEFDKFGNGNFGIFNPACTPEQAAAIQERISKKCPEIQEIFAIFQRVCAGNHLQESCKSLVELKKKYRLGEADFVACAMMFLAREEAVRQNEVWTSESDPFKKSFRQMTLFHLKRELPPEAAALSSELGPKCVAEALRDLNHEPLVNSAEFILELPREQQLLAKIAERCAADVDDPLCLFLRDGVRKFLEDFMTQHGEQLKQIDPSRHDFKTDVLKEKGLTIPNFCSFYFVVLLGKACRAFEGHDPLPPKFARYIALAVCSEKDHASKDALEKLAAMEGDTELQACVSFARLKSIEELELLLPQGDSFLRQAAVARIAALVGNSSSDYQAFLGVIKKESKFDQFPANDFFYYYLQVVFQPEAFLAEFRKGSLPMENYGYRSQYTPKLPQFLEWMWKDPLHRNFKARFLDILLQREPMESLLPKDAQQLQALELFCLDRATELHQKYRENPETENRSLIYKYYMLIPRGSVRYFHALAGRIELMYQHWTKQVGVAEGYERVKDMRKEARIAINYLANRCFKGMNDQECAAAEEVVEKILMSVKRA